MSYHRRKASAYESLVKAALVDEDRLARITAGGIHLDREMDEMEIDEELED
jgi:MAternally affected uncoordination